MTEMIEIIISIVSFAMFATCFIFAERQYRYENIGVAITLAVFAAIFLIVSGVALCGVFGVWNITTITAAITAMIRVSGLW